MTGLTVNGHHHQVAADPTTPLLTVLRQELKLYGAKQGCAKEQCYACCVLVDGRTQPSCQLPVGNVGDMEVTTVEHLEPIQEFFLAEQVGQCGFCIAGMVVAAEGLLRQARQPNDAQIREALDTNLCRCGVYDRVRRAIRFRIGQPEPPIWEVRPQEPMAPDDPAAEQPRISPSLAAAPDVDSWLRIGADGTVTVLTGKVELGQGIATALATIAADGLGVDPGRVSVVMADTDRTPNEGVTSGSLSVEASGGAVARAAATARAVLLERAALKLETSVHDLTVDDGTVAEPGGRSVTFWKLQGDQPFGVEVDVQVDVGVDLDGAVGASLPAMLATSDGPTDGMRAPRVDLPAKVSGVPSYIHDLRLPGMTYGRVVRPPAYESRLVSLDSSPVEGMAGVVAVVRDGSFLAVVAEEEPQAMAAAAALAEAATWTEPEPRPDPLIELTEGETEDYFVVEGVPVAHDVASPATSAAVPEAFDVAATYTKPFTMHGSLGPSAAVAEMSDDRLTVWSHTQGAFLARDTIAEVLGMAPDQVRVIHREGAGCYGHNGADDVALDAAIIAAAVPGNPVQVLWSREDEHRWEPYGPAMMVSLRADLADGRVTAFDSENWSYTHTTRPKVIGDGSTNLLAAWHRDEAMDRPVPRPIPARHIGAHRNSDPLYSFDNRRVQTHLSTATSYRTSALRGLGAFANVFAIESFIDELAQRSGIDPVRFRLSHLEDSRAAAVIEAVADAAAWDRVRAPGTGRGIAFARYKNQQTYLAVVVEVTVDGETGVITIDDATIAADCGRIISPDGVSNQLEGGCVQAASWTLKEAVRFDGEGDLVSIDWDSYPILRFSESFPIRTVLLDRPDQPPLGCGEAAQGPTAAAIANAVHNAIGVRLRDLPFTPDRVGSAIRELPDPANDQ